LQHNVRLGKAVLKEEVCGMAATTRRDWVGVKIIRSVFIALTLLTASIIPISAQNLSTASIDGLVTDQSGGALPGVTVTASSPALQVGQVEGWVPVLAPEPLQASQVTLVGTRIWAVLPASASESTISML
jgi:hypothetical protein